MSVRILKYLTSFGSIRIGRIEEMNGKDTLKEFERRSELNFSSKCLMLEMKRNLRTEIETIIIGRYEENKKCLQLKLAVFAWN
jgi:hypothetical protein